METLEELKKKMFKKSIIGECYYDTWNNNFKKIIKIDDIIVYFICIYEDSICREFASSECIENWKKITSEQFKDVYLAVLKDIQDPDLEDKEESNWNVVYKSIVNSINKEK